MHKIILIVTTLLFSTGTFAAGCGNASLIGRYSYEVSGVNAFPLPVFGTVTRSTHVVGQVEFDGLANDDGLGGVIFNGFGSAAGALVSKTGVGTYKVAGSVDCIAEGTMQWYNDDGITLSGLTSTFVIILDQMDNSMTPNKAYHANVVVTDNELGHSASGSLTKLLLP